MGQVTERLRKLVIQRAANHCEYCGLSQEGQEATFHVDHIIPVTAGGETFPENLALACVSCSLRKSARETATDPLSGEDVRLYHPRQDKWNNHLGHWESAWYTARCGADWQSAPRRTPDMLVYHGKSQRANHFHWDGVYLVGLTAIGRATVDALQMNRRLILTIRSEEARLGRHPTRSR